VRDNLLLLQQFHENSVGYLKYFGTIAPKISIELETTHLNLNYRDFTFEKRNLVF